RQGLTQASAYALIVLSDSPPAPIAALAERLDVDAGWATQIVDKLVERGAVRRRAADGDRRMRLIGVTPLGQRIADRLRNLAIAPEPLTRLSDRELAALQRIAQRAVDIVGAQPGARVRAPERAKGGAT